MKNSGVTTGLHVGAALFSAYLPLPCRHSLGHMEQSTGQQGQQGQQLFLQEVHL